VREDCIALRAQRVDTLPAKRPPRELPHRELQLLVIEREGKVLFERRPAAGIWAGLWSLPECAVTDDATAVARDRFGVDTVNPLPLPPLEHGFTHYTLTLHPVRLSATDSHLHRAFDSGEPQAWFAPEAADAAGLPSPIRRLVRALDLGGFALVPLIPARS
jgi:A/G-specific adenine glycosylase